MESEEVATSNPAAVRQSMGLARSDRMSGWLLVSRSSSGKRSLALVQGAVMTGKGIETDNKSLSLSKGTKSFSASYCSSSESMNLDRGVRLVTIGVPRGGGDGT